VGLGDLVQGREDLLAPLGLQVLRGAARPRAVDRRAGAVLAGEEAGREGEVGDGGEAGALGEVLEFALVGVAGDQVVVGLEGDVAGQALAVGELEGLREPLRRDVGRGDVPHLARLHQLVERADDLLHRHFRPVEVGVVEVDVVGAEAPEGRVGGGLDGGGRQALELRMLADLGGDHDVRAIAAGPGPLADDGLGLTAGVALEPC
jgi:hypothetical protein